MSYGVSKENIGFMTFPPNQNPHFTTNKASMMLNRITNNDDERQREYKQKFNQNPVSEKEYFYHLKTSIGKR